jgi:chloramphenicol-sensitive protein RarD
MNETRRGFAYGLTAHVLWGFFPIYFKALRPAGALEILAHRVFWSAVFVAVLLTSARRWRGVVALRRRPRTLAGVCLAALLIAVNWGVYIYGVNSGRIVESALGYFLGPLVSVAFGLAIFRERLRPWQWAALGIGASAVIILTFDYGRLPWIALTLAVSFSSYALVKKRLGLPPTDGLFVESAVLSVPALVYLGVLTGEGTSTFSTGSVWHALLLAASGIVTAVPLLMFAGAANRIPLSTLGLLQYVTPVLQFGLGVILYHEPMPAVRLAGFALVWLALVVFTVDGLRHGVSRRRASRALAADETGAPGSYVEV